MKGYESDYNTIFFNSFLILALAISLIFYFFYQNMARTNDLKIENINFNH